MTIQDMLYDRRGEIVDRVTNGESTNSIAKDFGCNAGSIWLFLQKIGIGPAHNRSLNYGKVDGRKGEIIQLFNGGMSAYAISKKLGISKPVVLRKLKKWGYDLSSKSKLDPNKPRLNTRLDEVIELHNKGMNNSQIAAKLGYSDSSVWTILNDHGYETSRATYHVDEDFFKKIDSHAKASILGWWYSDGNVRKEGKIRIAIQEEDAYILEWIKQQMQWDVPLTRRIGEGNRKPQVTLNIDRKCLADQLIALGCPPAKSLNLRFPDESIVPNEFLSSFMLGYFDGDGSIGNSGVSITGSWFFVNGLKDKLPCGYTGIYQRYKNKPPEKSAHSLWIGRRADYIKFAQWIYKDAEMFLKRKREKFGDIQC